MGKRHKGLTRRAGCGTIQKLNLSLGRMKLLIRYVKKRNLNRKKEGRKSASPRKALNCTGVQKAATEA